MKPSAAAEPRCGAQSASIPPHAGRQHRSSERLSYTVIGDPVNVAALEPLGKIYGVDIVIGEDTRIAAGDAIIVRRSTGGRLRSDAGPRHLRASRHGRGCPGP